MNGQDWPFLSRVHSRFSRLSFLLLSAGSGAFAQAPLLQDGASALRQARLDWAQGQPPLEPSPLPSFEVGWGGAGADGVYAPLLQGEGLGPGLPGWGLGLQGRYVRGGWSFSATLLGLRDHASTRGFLHRGALAYQWESGWRLALEQSPFDWGVGLLDGELLGASARAFPRLSLSTGEAAVFGTQWRLEAFAGQLDSAPPSPGQVSGGDRRRLDGALLRGRLGGWAELGLGTLSLGGPGTPGEPRLRQSLLEAKVRIPALARALSAQGASLQVSRSAAPADSALAWTPARNLANLLVVWDGWDLGAEYAEATPAGTRLPAGFSSHGDPLGDAHWRQLTTRSLALGMPLFLEGQGRLRLARATAPPDRAGGSAWFLQAEAQWRTPIGRAGASVASLRRDSAALGPHWGWSFSAFQSFRVF